MVMAWHDMPNKWHASQSTKQNYVHTKEKKIGNNNNNNNDNNNHNVE